MPRNSQRNWTDPPRLSSHIVTTHGSGQRTRSRLPTKSLALSRAREAGIDDEAILAQLRDAADALHQGGFGKEPYRKETPQGNGNRWTTTHGAIWKRWKPD
jgi:hypothetical protein